MAIDITIQDHRSRLAKALRRSFTDAGPARRIRRNLQDIYRDKTNAAFEHRENSTQDLGTILNLFQKFVKGHLLTLAFFNPKWAIDATTTEGRGLDKGMQAFMGRYSEIIGFNSIQKQLALDSAFGWAVAKVSNGIAPKGISAPVSPRFYRLNPDMFIVDPTAATLDECAFVGDMYLVPLNEAQAHPGFRPELAAKLTEYKSNTGSSQSDTIDGNASDDSFAEPMTRLIDVYIKKQGKVYTWPAPDDEFNHIATTEAPLGERESPINPYCLLSLMEMPGYLVELSRLRALRGLHLVSNEMLIKGINQARNSQRNPVGDMGAQQEMTTALNAGDGNPFFTEDFKNKIGLYTIPGPDPSILNLGNAMQQMFGKEAGNLDVALGASAGADTARQTEALIGQISASQSLDRHAFETFLAEIAKKMLTLAFPNEALELATRQRIPGTQIEVSRLWEGAKKNPRAASIDSFNFKVVPFSTAFRTPQERLGQLNQASSMVQQWLMAKAQGAPIAIEAVMNSVSEAFDLVPELQEWWSGEEPTPAEKTANTYQSMAEPAKGSDIRYQGQGSQQQDAFQANPQAGGGVSQ